MACAAVYERTQIYWYLHCFHTFNVKKRDPVPRFLTFCKACLKKNEKMCYVMGCFGTSFTYAQTCDYVRVQSATQWTASVHTLHMPMQACDYVRVQSATQWTASEFGCCLTHAQTCDNVRVQSATQWTASVHTLHMPKPGITFVLKVLRNGLLQYMLCTCPNM